MADSPKLSNPYSNQDPAVSFISKDPTPSTVPKGKGANKMAQGQLALQGLIGLK